MLERILMRKLQAISSCMYELLSYNKKIKILKKTNEKKYIL